MSIEDSVTRIVDEVKSGNIGNDLFKQGAASMLYDELMNNNVFGAASQRVTNMELAAVTRAFEKQSILPTFDRDQVEEVKLKVQGTAGSHEAFVIEAIVPGARKGESHQELYVLGSDGKFRAGRRFKNAEGGTYIGSLPFAEELTADQLKQKLERANLSPKLVS